MTRALPAAILLCLFSTSVLRGQEAAFDVASIRPNRTNATRGGVSRDGARLTFENVTLRECIMFAYSIPTGRDHELSGPAWLDEERVDILATFPAAATRDQIRQMTQRLLRDRFGLVIHKENRSIKAYVLALDRTGHKLKPSQVTDGSFTFRTGSVSLRGFSMQGFADRLSGPTFRLDRPVMDQTGLTGVFDFEVEWSASEAQPGPSIFTALREQLGLLLRPEDTTAAVLIVDKMNRTPTEN